MIAAGNTLCKVVTNITTMPYIKGHITDNAKTFTFKVNNSDVTVNVDSNGWWIWEKENTNITSLQSAFKNKYNLNKLIINLPSNPDLTSIYEFIYCNSIISNFPLEIKIIKFDTASVKNFAHSFNNANIIDSSFINKIDTSSATNLYVAFHLTGCSKIDLSNINVSNVVGTSDGFNGIRTNFWNSSFNREINLGNFLSNPNLESQKDIIMLACNNVITIAANCIKMSACFLASQIISKQSILNIINAVQENNLTFKFHSVVYNKCASGGEWYTDIQNAIDAKALQGYTVTLISA